jgi:hypothetical protein
MPIDHECEAAEIHGKAAWAQGVVIDGARAYSDRPHIQAAWRDGWLKADDRAMQQFKDRSYPSFRQSPYG